MAWLTVMQAAEQAGTSRRIVQRLIQQKRLPAKKVGGDTRVAVWLIDSKYLDRIKNRPTGRPRRSPAPAAEPPQSPE